MEASHSNSWISSSTHLGEDIKSNPLNQSAQQGCGVRLPTLTHSQKKRKKIRFKGSPLLAPANTINHFYCLIQQSSPPTVGSSTVSSQHNLSLADTLGTMMNLVMQSGLVPATFATKRHEARTTILTTWNTRIDPQVPCKRSCVWLSKF